MENWTPEKQEASDRRMNGHNLRDSGAVAFVLALCAAPLITYDKYYDGVPGYQEIGFFGFAVLILAIGALARGAMRIRVPPPPKPEKKN